MGKHFADSKDKKRQTVSNRKFTNARHSAKSKKKRTNFLIKLLTLFSTGLIIYSLYHIYLWYQDSNNVKEDSEEILNITQIQEINDTESVTVIKSEEDNSSPYWDYIKMKLINVDFSSLKEINSDVVGWIQVNGTNINYPFVQTSNNDYYLTHSIKKEYNEAGWVFLDYRNNIETLNKNTIIYAHSRLDKTMFGSLKNLLKSNWYENKDNHIIKLSTENQNTLWQVFSVYHIPTTSDYLKVNFDSDSDFTTFANTLQSRSVYEFNTSVGKDDKILTLSTCYANDEKMVMHAKLIKYSDK